MTKNLSPEDVTKSGSDCTLLLLPQLAQWPSPLQTTLHNMVLLILILGLFPTVTLSDEGSPSHRHFYVDPEMKDVGVVAGDKVSLAHVVIPLSLIFSEYFPVFTSKHSLYLHILS